MITLAPVLCCSSAGRLFGLDIAKKFEPLLLAGIGSGMVLTNLPLAEPIKPAAAGQTGGLMWYFQRYLLATEIIPLLIFLGLGAPTDFEPMLSTRTPFYWGLLPSLAYS